MSPRRTGVPPGDEDGRRVIYDVRIWKSRVVVGTKGRAYQVRWTVARREHAATFRTKALADSHEAKLRIAA